jgi:hypothetical protein
MIDFKITFVELMENLPCNMFVTQQDAHYEEKVELVACTDHSLSLKMETFVNLYQTTRRHIPEDSITVTNARTSHQNSQYLLCLII